MVLLRGLASHPDHNFKAFICRGFRLRFRVGFDGTVALRSARNNHPSSAQDELVVSTHIASEVVVGRMVGPILSCWGAHVHTSPIGLIPKPHQPGQWRLITDLSAPTGHSVNAGIREDLCSLQYASVDDAVAILRILGRSTQLVKLDLKDAYRFVPVHPADHGLLGISWQNRIYVDRALPFGLRLAPKVFTAVADAIDWCLHDVGIHHQLHYLDDFLFFGHPGTDEAGAILSTVVKTFHELGVPVATHKTEGPAVCVSFLGILIDSQRMELRLPREKLMRIQSLITAWVSKRSCRRKELKQFVGHLSYAATVVRQGQNTIF